MKTPLRFIAALVVALFFAGLGLSPMPAQAVTPGPSPKDETVKKYLDSCWSKSAKEPSCDKLRKDAVEILKEDLRTLGSSAERSYLLTILPVFKSDEAELRIAAADAIGMIGAQDQDADLLAPLANDPVPDVRRAVAQMLQRGKKGSVISLLEQRTVSTRTGLTPETPADPGKYSMPVAPESTYLYYASDAAYGRLSYTAKSMNDATAFFKAKAKKGPYKLEEFKEKYRYQLDDEQQARDTAASNEAAKQMEHVKPDPANTGASMEKIQQVLAAGANKPAMMVNDLYLPNIFSGPTVYVLEERQIGQRSYPIRYVVLYQDLALKRPGYRLSWMTVPEDAVKAAQADSMVSEKQEEALKKQDEALKKREEALPDMVKKKDEQEKKKFKKGQADLEKELGF
jgi:HEAT repeats